MRTFAALSFHFRHVYYVVLVCVSLRALQIALPDQLQRYSATHEAWTQPHVVNFTATHHLNESVIANASYTGMWDVSHLIAAATAAKEAENPTKSTIFSLWNAKTLLVSALTYVVSYYWNLYLERRFPARTRGGVAKESSEGVSENAEEQVVKRWIASGRVKQASLNGWNTFYKWVLDIFVGRALIEVTAEMAWIAMRDKDVLKSLKGAPLEILFGTLGHLLTPFTISSLIGMIVVPANQRVVFSTGFYFLCSMFFHVVISLIFPQFLLTNTAKRWAKFYTEGAWLGALDRHEGKNSQRLDQLMREL